MLSLYIASIENDAHSIFFLNYIFPIAQMGAHIRSSLCTSLLYLSWNLAIVDAHCKSPRVPATASYPDGQATRPGTASETLCNVSTDPSLTPLQCTHTWHAPLPGSPGDQPGPPRLCCPPPRPARDVTSVLDHPAPCLVAGYPVIVFCKNNIIDAIKCEAIIDVFLVSYFVVISILDMCIVHWF